MCDKNRTIIAISGASASGKSLFADTIYSEFLEEYGEPRVAIIREDSYYRDQSHLTFEERLQTNYDHPDAFEHDLLLEHLELLRQGQAIDMPVYDYHQHTRSNETIRIEPKDVIIVEGILLFTDELLCDFFDIKVFIDAPLDHCLIRRIQRDTKRRGRSLESVTAQYLDTVRPMYYQFIKPSRAMADVVVTGGGYNRIALDIVKAKIRELLRDSDASQATAQ